MIAKCSQRRHFKKAPFGGRRGVGHRLLRHPLRLLHLHHRVAEWADAGGVDECRGGPLAANGCAELVHVRKGHVEPPRFPSEHRNHVLELFLRLVRLRSNMVLLYRNQLFKSDNTTKLDYFKSLDNLFDHTAQHQFSLRINYLIDFNRISR